ncbi:MAG TPA: glutamate ABC transporter substrate-binding protein [Candidatus Limnocylindria bacterium]
MRGLTRTFALGLVLAFIATACTSGGTATPSATPAASASTSTRPKFDLATYQYSLQTKGKIRIGTQEDNTPFSVKNPATGKWDGFDVAYGREIAKAIFGESDDPDKFIEWVPVTSATRIPTLTDNKADVIIKTFTINEDRKKQIDFTDVYFKTGQRILVKKDNTSIKEAADLAGKTVCAQRGSTSEQNITTATGGAARPLLLDSYPACLLALQQGQADAISTDETILFGLAKADPNTKLVGKYFSTELYGIGVKKSAGGDRTGFVDFLNRTQVAMITSGVWATLYEKYISPVSFDKKRTPDD